MGEGVGSDADKEWGSDCMRTSATLLGTKASRAGVQQCTAYGSGCTKQTALVPQP